MVLLGDKIWYTSVVNLVTELWFAFDCDANSNNTQTHKNVRMVVFSSGEFLIIKQKTLILFITRNALF